MMPNGNCTAGSTGLYPPGFPINQVQQSIPSAADQFFAQLFRNMSQVCNNRTNNYHNTVNLTTSPSISGDSSVAASVEMVSPNLLTNEDCEVVEETQPPGNILTQTGSDSEEEGT